MIRKTFNEQFAALVNAFPNTAVKLSEETQDVYWAMLQEIPDEKFIKAVKRCLGTCRFFPTIAELGEASLPTKTRLAPYNPYVYQPPIEVDWQEQLAEKRRVNEPRLPPPIRGVLRSIVKGVDDGPKDKKTKR